LTIQCLLKNINDLSPKYLYIYSININLKSLKNIYEIFINFDHELVLSIFIQSVSVSIQSVPVDEN